MGDCIGGVCVGGQDGESSLKSMEVDKEKISPTKKTNPMMVGEGVREKLIKYGARKFGTSMLNGECC